MDGKLNIKVLIAERHYPLKVSGSEEETVRKAAKQINDLIIKYKQSYGGQESQDYLAMAALHFSTEVLNLKHNIQDKSLEMELMKLEQELDRITE